MNEQQQFAAWREVADPARKAMSAAWSCDVPAEATAILSRWWQLETWLRSLVYVELRARDGVKWIDCLDEDSRTREDRDRAFPYMQTPDGEFPLAYVDVSTLFDLTLARKNRNLFETSLVAHTEWQAEVERLRRIRHRISHCRRPHQDDLSRIEQALRDMEHGAFKAVATFNEQSEPYRPGFTDEDIKKDPFSIYINDPVVDGWVRKQHADAARLIDHVAGNQYDISFCLHFSRRPWVAGAVPELISGTPGYLWHASWMLSRGVLDLARFWTAIQSIRDLVVFVSAPTSSTLEVVFAGVDDPASVCDAIGKCFDSLLTTYKRREATTSESENWWELNRDLDPRIQVSSPWAFITEDTPASFFEAS